MLVLLMDSFRLRPVGNVVFVPVYQDYQSPDKSAVFRFTVKVVVNCFSYMGLV